MARFVDYWEDLKEIPEEGPFVVCGAPLSGPVRIEQVRAPDGVGCPIVLSMAMNVYREKHKIPRGRQGADLLNKLYHEGAFEWHDGKLEPKTEDKA